MCIFSFNAVLRIYRKRFVYYRRSNSLQQRLFLVVGTRRAVSEAAIKLYRLIYSYREKQAFS